jgi:hypothetical protein
VVHETLQATEDMRQMRAECPGTQVEIRQHDIPQMLEKGTPPVMVREDAQVQHLRGGQQHTWKGLLNGPALGAWGVAIVDRHRQAMLRVKCVVPGREGSELRPFALFVWQDAEPVTGSIDCQ